MRARSSEWARYWASPDDGVELLRALETRRLLRVRLVRPRRAAVKAVAAPALNLAGLAFRTERKAADRILKELKLHS